MEKHEQIRKSEKLFQVMIEKSADIITLSLPEGKLIYVSPSLETMLGFTQEEFFNLPAYNFIHPDDLPELIEQVTGLLNTPGKSFNCEQRLLHKNGTWRWCEGTITNMLHDTDIGALVSNFRDITDRRNTEELLQQEEFKFRELFEKANDVIYVHEAETGRVLQVNQRAVEITGFSKEELLTMSMEEQITDHPNYSAEKAIGYIQKAAMGEPQCFEWLGKLKGGNTSWFEVNLKRATIAGKECILAFFHEINERKKTEEKVAEQAALLDITMDAIMVRDMDKNILFWNKGAEELYGHKKEDVIGKNVFNLIYGANLFELEQEKQIDFINGIWQGELKNIDKYGKTILVDSKWTLISDIKGNPTSIMVVNTDITRKKLMETEYLRIQRMDSIGTLASGISHDLNNVLAPIMMSIEILKMRINDKRGLDLIEAMTKSTQHGALLVKQLLTFARGVEGTHTIIELENILLEVKQIMTSALPKNIDIITELPVNLNKISGDSTQLSQVIMNLMVNARDAMPQGGLIKISAENVYIDSIFIQMKPEARVGNFISLSVSDTGTGIPKNIINKIFEPFFTTKDFGKGTGLGLSTTIGIIKSHGGFINVSSEEGKGTKFNIYLPVIEKIPDDISSLKNAVTNLIGNGETILLIEDDNSIVEAGVQILEQNNYKVLKANDGVEGLTLYLQNMDKISLVITDITLPLMDGNQLVHAIFKINPGEKIIVMSGLEKSENIRGLGDRITFLSKPFLAYTFLMALREKLNC
jgi:PAS domain S-box-containing protein